MFVIMFLPYIMVKATHFEQKTFVGVARIETVSLFHFLTCLVQIYVQCKHVRRNRSSCKIKLEFYILYYHNDMCIVIIFFPFDYAFIFRQQS